MISGAASNVRIMCCPTRAENNDTDSGRSGEISVRRVISQPP
jgi:hypothetical protein